MGADYFLPKPGNMDVIILVKWFLNEGDDLKM